MVGSICKNKIPYIEFCRKLA